jgi:hypothetical protein
MWEVMADADAQPLSQMARMHACMHAASSINTIVKTGSDGRNVLVSCYAPGSA